MELLPQAVPFEPLGTRPPVSSLSRGTRGRAGAPRGSTAAALASVRATAQRTRVAQYRVAEARSHDAHQVRSERLERSFQREADAAGHLARADAGRLHALRSHERAKEHRLLKHEYNQAVGRSIRATEAEWDMERSQSGVRGQAFPAAFGSYSNWAGAKEVAESGDGHQGALQVVGKDGVAARKVGSAGRMQFEPAATADLRDRQSIYDSQGGDPGAYTPYTHIEIAAEAAFTFNAIGREQTGARAERTHQPTAQGGSQSGGVGDSSSSTATAVPAESPPWWLFKFNSIPLREEASSGELQIAISSHAHTAAHPELPAHPDCQFVTWKSGAGTGGVDRYGRGSCCDDAREGANSASSIQSGSVPTVGSYLGARRPLHARARKELRERSEAAEREAQWKARHHRGAHVPPPLPTRMRKKRAAGTRNYYAILRVAPSATADQIKHAYHKLAREWHPDKATNVDPDKARRMFVLVARAYEVLGDRATRNAYDAGEDVDAKAKFSAK